RHGGLRRRVAAEEHEDLLPDLRNLLVPGMVLVRAGQPERELEDATPSRARPDQGPTVSGTVSQSCTSPGFAISHAVLVMVPFAVGLSTTCTVADVFFASVPPSEHVI